MLGGLLAKGGTSLLSEGLAYAHKRIASGADSYFHQRLLLSGCRCLLLLVVNKIPPYVVQQRTQNTQKTPPVKTQYLLLPTADADSTAQH